MGNRNRHASTLNRKQPLHRGEYKELVAALAQRMDQQGLSIRDLAQQVGRPRSTLHKSLSGQRRMDPIEFVELCEALRVPDPVALVNSVRRK